VSGDRSAWIALSVVVTTGFSSLSAIVLPPSERQQEQFPYKTSRINPLC
jgi:hypothetical protein